MIEYKETQGLTTADLKDVQLKPDTIDIKVKRQYAPWQNTDKVSVSANKSEMTTLKKQPYDETEMKTSMTLVEAETSVEELTRLLETDRKMISALEVCCKAIYVMIKSNL